MMYSNIPRFYLYDDEIGLIGQFLHELVSGNFSRNVLEHVADIAAMRVYISQLPEKPAEPRDGFIAYTRAWIVDGENCEFFQSIWTEESGYEPSDISVHIEIVNMKDSRKLQFISVYSP